MKKGSRYQYDDESTLFIQLTFSEIDDDNSLKGANSIIR
jgi:hypothetical protein